MTTWQKTARSISIIFGSIKWFLIEIYFFYTNPYPVFIFLHIVSRTNHKLRRTWIVKKCGRKPIDDFLRSLIIEMKVLNPGWGGQRISDELRKIGISVSKPTVLKVLREEGFHFNSPHKPYKWRKLLADHKYIIGIDFTRVIDLFGAECFIFVICDLKSRNLLLINATYHPTQSWVTQQFRNAFMDAKEIPTLCISDHDGIFGKWLEPLLKEYYGMTLVQIPYRKPWYNGIVKRFFRSIKMEAFSRIVPFSLFHIRDVCHSYQNYFNHHRCHQGIGGRAPNPANRSHQAISSFQKYEQLGGLITSYDPIFSDAA